MSALTKPITPLEDSGPTIAVALRYEEEDGAPVVVATGRGSLAQRIVESAKTHGVAIDENPMLASALEHVPVDEPIPQELYQAVAEVIGWVLKARKPGVGTDSANAALTNAASAHSTHAKTPMEAH